MDQTTAMKITGITFTDFRNHKAPEKYTFGDVCYITGHNGTGKTTMAHGVCYALYGVSYYGEQKIERLMNENAAGTQVQLDFIDRDGRAHTLIRNRNGDKTALLLDTYTVRQADIDRMFCSKDAFLSMFNPFYLAGLGEKGRALILKYLQPVSADAVLEQLSDGYRKPLQEIDLTHASPEALLKDYRGAIRQVERQTTILEGNIQSMQDAVQSAERKLNHLYIEKQTAEEKLSQLAKRQFEGIDRDELAIQRDVLLSRLSENSSESQQAAKLRAKIEAVRQNVYISKYAQAQAETQAEIKALAEQYRVLAHRVRSLKPGAQCPTCFMRVTLQNLSEVQNSMTAQLEAMAAKGNGLVERGKEIAMLDRKSRETFAQFQADDLNRLTAELSALEQESAAGVDRTGIRRQIEQIDGQLRYGNLTEEEFTELHSLRAELTGIEAQIQAVEDMADEHRLQSAMAQREAYESEIQKYRSIVTALTEYMCKRAELAVDCLQMPNVKIKLLDVVRTTGEAVNVFRFTYKGRDYATLSLSEKTLAGIEIAAMMRRLTGFDCPICIDNSESIAAFNSVAMPSQTLLLRMVKGQPLTVHSRNNIPKETVKQQRKAA